MPSASLTLASIAASPSARITLVMALLFGAMGVAVPFLPRWLQETRGLDSLQIAVVLSAAQMSRIVVGPLIATWADGFNDRSAPIKRLALAAVVMHAGFFLSSGFLQLLILSFAAGVSAQAMVPLVEGGLLRASVAPGGLAYGPCRAAGSGVFIFGTVAGGFLVQAFGIGAAPLLLLSLLIGAAAAAIAGLRRDPAPARARVMGFRGRLKVGLGLLRQPPIALAIAAAGLVQASHAFFYTFTAIVWRDQGISDGLIGLLIACGVLAEICLLATLPFVERRFQPESLIAFGAAAAIVRWGAFAFAPGLALLWPLQVLHALTFAATHVGALRMIQRSAPEEVSGLAQTLYAAIASGLFMGLSSLGSGELHKHFQHLGYLAMAGLGMLGLALIGPVILKKV